MKRWNWLSLVLAAGLCAFGMACGDDEQTGSPDGGGTGGTGGSGGSGGGGDCHVDPDPENLDCPEAVNPVTGCYANKGACCYRKSNTAQEAEFAAAGATTGRTEYRLNYSKVLNHPSTLGLEAIVATAATRAENEEQSLLWGFETPRDENGAMASGEGATWFGQGRYNCDGTYSFYGPTAAPSVDGISDDPARWEVTKSKSTVDITVDGAGRNEVAFADRPGSREFSYTPYVNTETFELEWELISMGFDVTEIDTSDEALNCKGTRKDSTSWEPQGEYIAYAPLDANDGSYIPTTMSSFCSLISFGIQADTPEDPAAQCSTEERCDPEDEACRWVKLPDSLCPFTTDDQSKWGCHVGYEDNPDNEPTNCTQEAPTGVLDPEMGATSEGQCCDPMGTSTTLPACNSFLIRNSYVAAAADITDELADSLQVSCKTN